MTVARSPVRVRAELLALCREMPTELRHLRDLRVSVLAVAGQLDPEQTRRAANALIAVKRAAGELESVLGELAEEDAGD